MPLNLRILPEYIEAIFVDRLGFSIAHLIYYPDLMRAATKWKSTDRIIKAVSNT